MLLYAGDVVVCFTAWHILHDEIPLSAAGPYSSSVLACVIWFAASGKVITRYHCVLQGLMLVVVWPAIVCFTAAGTFFTIKYQQQINQQLGTGFGYTICLSFINIISSQAVETTTHWEEWHPSLSTNVSLISIHTQVCCSHV